MTVFVEPPTASSAQPSDGRYPIARRMRWPAAVVLALGGILETLPFQLEPEQEDARQRVAWWAEHGTRMQLAQTAGLLTVFFLLLGTYLVWKLVREDSRRLAAVGALMIVSAMVGLAVVNGVELAAYWASRTSGADAAVAILDVKDPGVAGIVGFVMFLPMAVLGNLLWAIAMWRSLYVPRVVAGLVIAFVILDFVLNQGVLSHVSEAVQGLLLAWTVVTARVREPRAKAAQPAQ
jgi:hypothetical protein